MTLNPPLPHGVFAAALTPLNQSLAPDHDAFVDHALALLEGGCDGLAVLGSTGEANSLPVDRRQALIEAATDRLPADRLLMGTGSCAVDEAVRLTKASLQGGAVNVLVLPPFYYKPQSDDGAFAFFARLIDSVDDQRLRVFLYNFPQLTGFAFSANLVDRLRRRYGPVIAGMKDSSGDWESMKARCGVGPDFAVYAGTERFLLDILGEGGAGCVTATANLTAPLCQAVLSAWRAGAHAEAKALQERLTAIRLEIQAHPLVPAQKALLEHRTGDPGWRHLLPPFTPFPAADAAALAARLDALGLWKAVRI